MIDEGLRESQNATQTTPTASDSGRRLLVVHGENVAYHPLSEGILLIGNSKDADIVIDAPSVAPRHVRLYVSDSLRVQDCGSETGTMLRDTRLAPNELWEIFPNDILDLGNDVHLVVQKYADAKKLRRLWSHGYFEALLEEECARADRSRAVFTVLHVRVIGDATPEDVQYALGISFRASDIIARYGPIDYEILLVDADMIIAERVLQRLYRNVSKYNFSVKVGMAVYPRDGRDAGSLVGKASAAAREEIVAQVASPEPVVTVTKSGMEPIRRLVDRVAPSNISIILQGETGVGKEVMARLIHQQSTRADKPFVSINCGAVSETLLESELFGHERGAFTGASLAKAGILESANGGTIFLDELGEMPLNQQVKLLRVLEQREVLRVGALKARPIDVRVIAASNRNLEEEVGRERFRSDLYFRLNGVTIAIPPLRERTEEIEELALHFLANSARELNLEHVPILHPDALALFKQYDWPGNIRELRNVIERAVLLCTEGEVRLEHLPTDKMASTLLTISRAAPSIQPVQNETVVPRPNSETPLHAAMQELERDRIVEALERFGGNQTRAAKHLGISRGTLSTRMDTYGITRPRK